MNVIECQQGTPEWFNARAGVITASNFAEIRRRLKSGPNKGDYTSAARDYAFRVAIERISGRPLEEDYTPWQAKRGMELESDARSLHAFTVGLDVEPTGLVRTDDDVFGASADGLIGDDGGAEYKCLLDVAKIRNIIFASDVSDYMDQIQGGMWITGRLWWHFCLYVPQLKDCKRDLTIHEVKRDDDYIEAMERDLVEFSSVVDRYEAMLREDPGYYDLEHVAGGSGGVAVRAEKARGIFQRG